ncbi:MAG: hypothetical protein JO029_03470 [Candidatus Eremiobacteraeota bacterium]|nr:hypothetical protein [Candidatus Eremiobacteraeota bacterium]MBV8433322.1 hypothetical protein [Candidatus Eremiobacteraeota bacterium]MBV8656016.1 hypothetical protein [Candidatus Eremiobacteraeota bacterium]
MDGLTRAVIEDLSSRYCPHSEYVFFVRLTVSIGTTCLVAAALFFSAYIRRRGASLRVWPFAWACVLVAFAVGWCALDLYALSGCNGNFQEGLVWDWP